jgi:MoaA/NifB/PqqE/SkfB family radical SAM enzyme
MATLYQKTKLFRGLLTGEVAYTGPSYVVVDITQRCNLQCVGCMYHSPYSDSFLKPDSSISDIPLPLIDKLCGELRAINTNTLVIQGTGEPLLHPDFSTLVTHVKATGFNIVLLTNGTLLGKNFIQTFIDMKLDLLKISLWTASAQQYQQNYPGTNPDNFQKVVDGVKLVARLKAEQKSNCPSVVLHFPINRNNFQDTDAMVDLALETACNGVSFAPMYSANDILDSYLLSPEEERWLRGKLIQAKKRLNSLSLQHNIPETILRYELGETVWQKMPCYIPWFHARIRVDGIVHPCGRCNLVMGDLHKNTFDEIWKGSAYRAFRRKAFENNGLNSMREHCDCSLCCLAADNARVHRFFKWVLPFCLNKASGMTLPIKQNSSQT